MTDVRNASPGLTLLLRGTRTLFASELTEIAQGGLFTLVNIVKHFDQLRATAESMSSPSGTVRTVVVI